jgi:hypothetical protein
MYQFLYSVTMLIWHVIKCTFVQMLSLVFLCVVFPEKMRRHTGTYRDTGIRPDHVLADTLTVLQLVQWFGRLRPCTA